MAVKVNKLQVAHEAASLDLLMAWAILRPMPGKMGMLLSECRNSGWATWSPRRMIDVCGAREELMFPGYLFVRPPQGQRRMLGLMPFSAGPLEIVIFDALRARIDAEEAAYRQALQEIVVRKRGSRKLRSVKSFDRLRELLGLPSEHNELDGRIETAQLSQVRCSDSRHMVGLLSAYERTDDEANEASAGAEAILRRRMYFQ